MRRETTSLCAQRNNGRNTAILHPFFFFFVRLFLITFHGCVSGSAAILLTIPLLYMMRIAFAVCHFFSRRYTQKE